MYLKKFEELEKTSVFFMLKPIQEIFYFVGLICLCVIAVLVWAFCAPMDDVIKASVLLRPISTISSIKCVTSGQICYKAFENDEEVSEGDLLFSLDIAVQEKELEAYKKELDKVIHEIYVNDILFETINSEKLPTINKEDDAFIKSNNYFTEFQRYKTLIEDVETKLNREIDKPESLKIPQNIIDLQNKLMQTELTFETWQTNQTLLALDSAKTLQSSKRSIENHIAELDRVIKNSTIYAPISGKVSEITKLNIGDYLLAGVEVLKIVPQNDEQLKADIYVDPSYVARVKKGNPVKMKFPGLPPSRYGIIETKISAISPDVNYVNGNACFVVEAKIDTPYLVAKNGQVARLLPGITAESRIITEKTTVIHMIMRKLDFIN